MSSESVSKKRKREKSAEQPKIRRFPGDPFRDQLFIPLVPFDRPAKARPRQPPKVCRSRAELSENPNVRMPPDVSPAVVIAAQHTLPEKENEEVKSPIAKKKKLVAKNKPNFKSSIAGQAGLSKKPIRLANPNKLSKPKSKDFHSIREEEEIAAKIIASETSPKRDVIESEEKDRQKKKDQERAQKESEILEKKKQKRKEEKRLKKEAALREQEEAALREQEEAALRKREEEEKKAALNESMTDDDEPLPALIQKLNEEEAKKQATDNVTGKESLETIWARATEKKHEEEKDTPTPKRKHQEIVIMIDDDDDEVPSNSTLQMEVIESDPKNYGEERTSEDEAAVKESDEPESDFLAFHKKRIAEKKRRASAANSLKLQTDQPSNQIIAEEKKREAEKKKREAEQIEREAEEKIRKAEKKKRKAEQLEREAEEIRRKTEKKKREAKEKLCEDDKKKEKTKTKEIAAIADEDKISTTEPTKVRDPIENDEEERRKRKEKKRAKKEAALQEREKEKKRLKKEKRRKEEESIRQEEEEIKRKKEEEEAKRIADAQAIEDEARARAAERKKREAEEAEANPQPKEQKSFNEIWLAISYKSGCSGHRIVEYTDGNGKQWYEKQMLLSLNDRIAKKKSKYWCSLEYVYPLEFSNKKLEGCTDIRNERTPNLGEWEISRVLDIKIGPDTVLYQTEFKKFRKQIVVNKYFGGANDTRKPLDKDRHWLADFEMDFFLKNPENNKELTERIRAMILERIGRDDVALDRWHHAREKCNANEKREGHFPRAHAHLAKKEGEEFKNGVTVRIISESGEFAEKKNFKQTREEMLSALDDIDSLTSICKHPPSEPILPKNKNSTELSPDYSAPATSYMREYPDMFTVKNEFHKNSYLNYEKERVKYYRDKVNNCEQALKRAEDHYRSNMREWKAQKKYHMVREARWARDHKSAELKTLQSKLMESERYMFPTHKIDKFQTDTECLKDDTKDMIYIQQGIYGLAKDKRRSLVAYNLISEREEVRLKNMNTSKHVPLCEHEEFKS